MENKLNFRLRKVLHSDKQKNPQYIQDVIRSDVFYLLNNYYEVEYDDIEVTVDLSKDNLYKIKINATGDRIKMMSALPQ